MISLALRVITKYRYVSRLKHAAVTDIDDISISPIFWGHKSISCRCRQKRYLPIRITFYNFDPYHTVIYILGMLRVLKNKAQAFQINFMLIFMPITRKLADIFSPLYIIALYWSHSSYNKRSK